MHYPDQQHKVHDPVEPAVLAFLAEAVNGRLNGSPEYHDLQASITPAESPLIEAGDESPLVDGRKISLGDYDYTTCWFPYEEPSLAGKWVYEIWLYQPNVVSSEASSSIAWEATDEPVPAGACDPGGEIFEQTLQSMLEYRYDGGRDYAIMIDSASRLNWVSEQGHPIGEIHVGYL